MGPAHGMTEAKTGIESPRRLHLPGDSEVEGNGDGCDFLVLDDALDQSHGLIAETSDRGEEHGVHRVRLQGASDLRGGGPRERLEMVTLNVTHEAEQPGANRADGALAN